MNFVSVWDWQSGVARVGERPPPSRGMDMENRAEVEESGSKLLPVKVADVAVQSVREAPHQNFSRKKTASSILTSDTLDCVLKEQSIQTVCVCASRIGRTNPLMALQAATEIGSRPVLQIYAAAFDVLDGLSAIVQTRRRP
jgi:hypothetical protein